MIPRILESMEEFIVCCILLQIKINKSMHEHSERPEMFCGHSVSVPGFCGGSPHPR